MTEITVGFFSVRFAIGSALLRSFRGDAGFFALCEARRQPPLSHIATACAVRFKLSNDTGTKRARIADMRFARACCSLHLVSTVFAAHQIGNAPRRILSREVDQTLIVLKSRIVLRIALRLPGQKPVAKSGKTARFANTVKSLLTDQPASS